MNRWDYSKAKSSYHFDPTVKEDANPPFKIVGRIEGDLAGVYRDCLKCAQPEPNGFLNRLKVKHGWEDKPFTQALDQAELEFLQLDPNHVFFYNLKATGTALYQQIVAALKFRRSGGNFHIQRPGGLFPYHIDELPGLKDNQADHWLDRDPKWAARLEIQVFDWQPGHVWAYGNTYWKQWRAGDIAWHDWRSTPHGTANIGRTDRVTLQISGLCSDETLEILEKGDFVMRF